MKKIICLLLCVIFTLICAFNVNATSRTASWYCARKKDHTQPNLPSDLEFSKEYNLYWIDDRYSSYDDGEKVIYLTFDVGYENGNVSKILDVMKEENVVGSFFILGNVVKRNPELVLRMANEGHIVCNHTLNHPNLVGKSEESFKNEVLGLENEYRRLTGKEMSKFFRPPQGTFDCEMLERAQALGYKTVFWSFAYADWDNDKQMDEDVALKKILDNIHNGEIMLIHPTSATNAKIMKKLIRELKQQGYNFATLDKIK